ncbi:MAG: protein kinase [Spirochaetes bacterium]|nr:protein kinase [Spirochaetota bacterium]
MEGTIIANRYEIINLIHKGGMGEVYYAKDLSCNTYIALKLLNNNKISNRKEDLIRFRMEASIAATIDHPNVIKIFDSGMTTIENTTRYYIAMEYVDGKNLFDIISPDLALPIETALSITIQLCNALEATHAKKIIHGDIKPDNVLICNEKAVLIDFGLARIKEFDSENELSAAGSIFYLAPEQIHVTRGTIDERSDLYSLGILLYRLVTGKLPFTGKDINTIIHQHIAVKPTPPSHYNNAIAPSLDLVIMKLLEKEPEHRYQTARGLVVDLQKILSGAKEITPGLNDSHKKIPYKTKMVGRERELSILKNAFDDAKTMRGSMWVIVGESGLGKTRLMDEFRRFVISSKGITIAAKCFPGHTKIPYSAIQEALGDYYSFFITLPPKSREKIASMVSAQIGELGEIVYKINPQMKELLGSCPPLVELRSNRESKRFHMVAAAFLNSLARATHPLVLLIDDIQWLDNGSIDVLTELFHLLNNSPLVVVMSFRKDAPEINTSTEKILAFAQECGTAITISPLTFPLMRELVANMLPFVPNQFDDLSKLILQASKGNPFHAIEIIKNIVRADTFSPVKNNNYTETLLNAIDLPDSVIASIIKRLSLFNEREMLLLSFAAVLGKNIDTSLLFSLASKDPRLQEYSETEIINIIDKAKDLFILEQSRKDTKTLQFVHDRILESLYSRINEDERKYLHRIIIGALEEKFTNYMQDELLFDLAHHSVMSEQPEKIIRYAFPAALKAKEKYANDVAIRYFTILLSCLSQHATHLEMSDARNLKIMTIEHLGEVYHTIGEYDRAIELFNSILGLIDDPQKKARIYQQISRAFFKKGDWLNCERHGQKGLRLLGEKLPIHGSHVIFSIVREIISSILQPLRAVFPQTKNSDEHYSQIIRIYLDLGWSYILSDIRKYVRTVLRTKNLIIRKIGKSSQLGMSYAILGSLWMSIGFFKLAERNYEKSLKIYELFPDNWGRGQTLQWLGYSFEWKADYSKSISYFKKSYDIFRSIGDVREMGMCVAGLIHNYTYLADYSAAESALDEYLDISSKTGDDYGISESWTYRARFYLEKGELAKAEECALHAFNHSLERNVLFTHCRASIELGAALLDKGDVPRAIHYLQHAKDLFDSSNFLRHYTVHLFYHLAEAMLCAIDANKKDTTQIKEIKKIKKIVLKGLKESFRWRTHRPGALRIAGYYYEKFGKPTIAERFYIASIDEARKIGRKYEEARSTVNYAAMLLREGKDKKGLKLLHDALAIAFQISAEHIKKNIIVLLGFEKIEENLISPLARSLSREKLSAAIQLCDEITSTVNSESFLECLLDNSLRIAGAQRALIFIVDRETNFPVLRASKTIGGSEFPEYSRNIVESVIQNGKSIVIHSACEDSTLQHHKSVLLANLRSIMCVPIMNNGSPIGAFYLDNPLTAGIFNENEARLLEVLLARAAKTIEALFTIPTKNDSESALKSIPDEKISLILQYIHQHSAEDITRENLAKKFNLNADYLGKIFKAATGKKIGEYINELRITQAAEKLKHTDALIIDIAYSSGFESLRTFNRAFKHQMGMSPKEYREKYTSKK